MAKLRLFLSVTVLLLVGSTCLYGQSKAQKDSLFHLIQAERAEQYEKYGLHYRLVQGHARFLHNDTYLLCDSASWNVDSKFIDAYGNVQVIQNNTMLKSERMLYWIDESKAQFSGPLVELFDKDGNTLRTEKLTYNTKDSVAVFEMGGAMKDKEGNVIESARGTYDAKEGLFTFEERVEIFMDTLEMKTQTLRYFTEDEKAHFGRNTHAWRDEGFLRADGGWYDRKNRVVRFADHVFLFDPSYDAWADELFYDQNTGAVDLYRNAQVLDSTNKSVYLGDHLQYLPATDSLSARGLLTGEPAIIYYGENEDHVVDTLYTCADTFFVYSLPRCDIPEAEIEAADKRLEDISYDALSRKRTEEAAAREEERIKKMREVGKLPPEWLEQQKKAEADSLAALAAADSLAALKIADSTSVIPGSTQTRATREQALLGGANLNDSTDISPPLDTLAVRDTLAPRDTLVPRDTTPVRFVHAWHGVKMYRSDIQAVCDSVVFTEIDSIARLYGSPALWNEVRNQLTADEMQLLMHDGSFERGSMITNAWLISEQDTTHYNQIKSTEMLGWFRDNKLYRFDALGGVSAIFYMTDQDVITTINVKESKSLTAAIKDGTAQRLLYMESIKSDVYPVGELEPEKQRLKDFKWRGDERPDMPEAVTRREPRTTERPLYAHLRRPLYRETNKYYDNYLLDLFEKRDAEKLAAAERKRAEQDSLERAAAIEALQQEEQRKAGADSIQATGALPQTPPDSTNVISDSTSTVIPGLTDDVMPGLTGHPKDSTAAAVIPDAVAIPDTSAAGALLSPVILGESKDPDKNDLSPASAETVTVSKQLSRAEKRAIRRAQRQARREARRAAREARRAAKAAARAARHTAHD